MLIVGIHSPMMQMADPLTALIHAVQVMNLLKTLIVRTLRQRQGSTTPEWLHSSSDPSPNGKDEPHITSSSKLDLHSDKPFNVGAHEETGNRNLFQHATLDRPEPESEEKFWSCKSTNEIEEDYYSVSGRKSPVSCNIENSYDNGEVDGILNRLSIAKGVRRLCRHPVFQLNKPVKRVESPLGL